MAIQPDTKVFIQGITHDGRTFSPSDWAERLAGVMSQFRPGGARPGNHLGYSPWCHSDNAGRRQVRGGAFAPRSATHEPMAWDFVINFAQQTTSFRVIGPNCLLPDATCRI